MPLAKTLMNCFDYCLPFSLKEILLIRSKGLIILDLDNTIYPESSWLFPAYKSISLYSGIPESYHFLASFFYQYGRKNIL